MDSWCVASYLANCDFYSKFRDKEAVGTRIQNHLAALFPSQSHIDYDNPIDKVQMLDLTFHLFLFVEYSMTDRQ